MTIRERKEGENELEKRKERKGNEQSISDDGWMRNDNQRKEMSWKRGKGK